MHKVKLVAPLDTPGLRYLMSVISGDASGLIAAACRGALWALSLLYRAGLVVFLLPYRLGIRKRKRLPCRVISIGNLTFGGTGKTPAVRTITAKLAERGLRTVILSRGHGGRKNRHAQVVSDGSRRLMLARDCGDEPAMLADLLPGTPVVIGRNRWESGRLAVKMFNPDVILLDDGLQYWQLHRDLDIVLLNAVEPFGYGHVMPRGLLREPLSGLRRADLILITNSDKVSSEQLGRVRSRAAAIAPGKLTVETSHRPMRLRELAGEPLDLDWLRGRRVCTVCSIGEPSLFSDSVAAQGAEVVREFGFPDHHMWREQELLSIAEEGLCSGAEALVTTEKDAVKLPDVELGMRVLVVDVMIEFGAYDVLDMMGKASVRP